MAYFTSLGVQPCPTYGSSCIQVKPWSRTLISTKVLALEGPFTASLESHVLVISILVRQETSLAEERWRGMKICAL